MISKKAIDKRAQSVIEYTLLIIAIAAAFLAMNSYVQRSVNARLHNIELEINPGIIIEKGESSSSGTGSTGTGSPSTYTPPDDGGYGGDEYDGMDDEWGEGRHGEPPWEP